MSLLEVTAVAKSYGPVVALRSADLRVEGGEIHALMGANGAGKSTLVKILTGVISRDAGEITVNGEPVAELGPLRTRRSHWTSRSLLVERLASFQADLALGDELRALSGGTDELGPIG
jgi:ABC-type multidrug transport system ATPase subunit